MSQGDRDAISEVPVVLASYARCRERGGFVKSFYQLLWSRNPKIQQRFHETDMDRQELIMRDAINTLLMYASGSVVARMGLDRIGDLHARRNHDVTPDLYAQFADALIETARGWDPRWTDKLEQQWRAALRPGLDYITARY